MPWLFSDWWALENHWAVTSSPVTRPAFHKIHLQQVEVCLDFLCARLRTGSIKSSCSWMKTNGRQAQFPQSWSCLQDKYGGASLQRDERAGAAAPQVEKHRQRVDSQTCADEVKQGKTHEKWRQHHVGVRGHFWPAFRSPIVTYKSETAPGTREEAGRIVGSWAWVLIYRDLQCLFHKKKYE